MPVVMRMQPSQPGSVTAIAKVDAARSRGVGKRIRFGSPVRTSTKFASLFQYCRPEAIAGRVQERLRLPNLREVVASHDRRSCQRRRSGDDRGDVDAVDADRPANGIERRRVRR